MTLDDLGNIGEIVGGVGVVVSLIYLALQIRHNTRSVRANSYQEILNHLATHMTHLYDREFADVVTRYVAGDTDLDRTDRIRARQFYASGFQHYQNAYRQFREGLITETQWRAFSEGFAEVLPLAGMRHLMETSAFLDIDPEFKAELLRMRDEREAARTG